jgi:predicted peroxiredoxin
LPDKLALLIWAATPEHPELLVTPLIHALAARALDAEVEIHFAGPAVRWLVEGVADTAYATPSREKAIGDFLREVVAEDVRLLACGMARAAWVGAGETLIPPAGAAGATAFVARSLDPAWRTLVF